MFGMFDIAPATCTYTSPHPGVSHVPEQSLAVVLSLHNQVSITMAGSAKTRKPMYLDMAANAPALDWNSQQQPHLQGAS